jgi:parallel beta-helix repeat protein
MKAIKQLFTQTRLLQLVVSVSALFAINVSLASQPVVVVQPNTVISSATTYDNVMLDMSAGSFIIENNATLTIKNSTIAGTISKNNPLLINVDNGSLNLNHNDVNIKVKGLDPHDTTQSLENVIQVGLGKLTMLDNKFSMDKPFRAGLLVTTSTIPTKGIDIERNVFEGFHGVLYLVATDNALVKDNTFFKNSYGHIVIIGANSRVTHNTIFFSGNNRLGNSIDVIYSDNVLVNDNYIFTPTCHAIYVIGSRNVTLDGNRISGGITHAVNVYAYPETTPGLDSYVKSLAGFVKNHSTLSNNITIINNIMSQNRYGVSVSDVDTINVANNIFIQRFVDNASRKFWTDNNVLLVNVSNVSWNNNSYQEAFSQDPNGDNSHSHGLVPFPATGGVSF